MGQAIDTGGVADHRKLRFNNIDELLAEIDRVVSADQAGALRRTGNWSAGQIFGHLATWINYGWEGYPMKVPWFVRWYLKRIGKRFIHEGMPQGVRIPKVEAGTYGTDVIATQDGAQRLRRALERLKQDEPPKFDSPAFGPMSLDDRVSLNLRHAELHLGYLHP